MTTIADKSLTFPEALEAEAIEQIAEVRKARIYQGQNPDYARRAKTAIGIIGAYVRLRATMENTRTNELITARMLGGDNPEVKRLLITGATDA